MDARFDCAIYHVFSFASCQISLICVLRIAGGRAILIVRINEYALIKSDGGNRPFDVRQPAFLQGANSCGMAMPKDEDCGTAHLVTSGSLFSDHFLRRAI